MNLCIIPDTDTRYANSFPDVGEDRRLGRRVSDSRGSVYGADCIFRSTGTFIRSYLSEEYERD